MAAEAALRIVEEDQVSKEVMTVSDRAKALKVVDSVSYLAAGDLWKSIKALRKKVDDTFSPIIQAAFQAHKTAVAKKKEVDAPLEDAERIIKRAMGDYDAEQDRLRKAEETRLAEIARKEEEERRKIELERLEAERKAEEERLLEAATAAEAAGDTEQVDAILEEAEQRHEEAKQEQATILQEPVYVPPVVLPKSTPKLAGGPVFQERWDFEIVSEFNLPREYLVPDLVKIRRVVTAMKGQTNINGVRAFAKRV